VSNSTDQPSQWRIWVEAARPRTLPAAVTPVVAGSALAWRAGAFDPGAAALCLAFALLVQIGTNLANDYFDCLKGADTPRRVGPRRAVAAGLVAPAVMKRATALVFLAAFGTGLGLVAWGGWWLVGIGAASILCGLAYTGGPWPLGYHGLGDVFVFVFFGLVAVGATCYVQTGFIDAVTPPVAAAVGLLTTNILVANNYRDADTDAAAGKRTLVVRFGRTFAVWQYGLSALVAFAAPVSLVVFAGCRWPVLLPLALAPWAAWLTRRLVRSTAPKEQIAILTDTGRLLAAFGLLLSVGLVWPG
jgi:1,4-dihydroxy-2-naphthoate octaprenyltransferase